MVSFSIRPRLILPTRHRMVFWFVKDIQHPSVIRKNLSLTKLKTHTIIETKGGGFSEKFCRSSSSLTERIPPESTSTRPV